MPRTTQKLALVVSLSSCVTLQNEIASKPPIIDIPGSSTNVIETLGAVGPIKKKVHYGCARLDYLEYMITDGCMDLCPKDLTLHILYPDSTLPLLKGVVIRPGDTLLLVNVQANLLKGESRIWVNAIDQLGVEFGFRLYTQVDETKLAQAGISPDKAKTFITTYSNSVEGIFFIDYSQNGSRDLNLLDTLQPGPLSITPGPSADSAILRYDDVVPCE